MYNFGLSECVRVKTGLDGKNLCVITEEIWIFLSTNIRLNEAIYTIFYLAVSEKAIFPFLPEECKMTIACQEQVARH